MRRCLGALAAAAVAWMVTGGPAAAQGPSVLQVRVEGTITPVIADHLGDALRVADREGHEALLVLMDTPGGLDQSMRDIVQDFLTADVPVVVFVPSGGRAASAGALITMAAHVAAMAPGTAIGAATPVDLQGGDISRKIINDAAAFAESIARARDRNVEFAVDAVREGRSVPAAEAARIGAIDLLADDVGALLAEIDGRTVALAGAREVTLGTAGATIVERDMSLFRRVLQWLADPNIAFLLISLGTLGIIYEFANPGVGGGGIAGAIMLILAFFGLSVLPVNAAGVILLALGAVLLLAEVLTPGVGVFAAGGTASIVLGGMFLFRGSVDVDLTFLVPVAGVVGLGTVLAGRLAWRARRARPTTGAESLVDERAVVRGVEPEGRTGQIFLNGAWWQVRTEGPALEVGQRVRVVRVDGLELTVEPETVERADGPPEGGGT